MPFTWTASRCATGSTASLHGLEPCSPSNSAEITAKSRFTVTVSSQRSLRRAARGPYRATESSGRDSIGNPSKIVGSWRRSLRSASLARGSSWRTYEPGFGSIRPSPTRYLHGGSRRGRVGSPYRSASGPRRQRQDSGPGARPGGRYLAGRRYGVVAQDPWPAGCTSSTSRPTINGRWDG